MADLQQGVPQFGSTFTDQNGNITQVWYQFLLNLFARTGGSTGSGFAPASSSYILQSSDSSLPNADVAANSPTISWNFGTVSQAKLDVNISAIVIPESQVVNLATDLGNRALTSTQVIAGTSLSGGGSLTGNVTLNVANNGVTNTQLAQMPTLTIKGNNTGGTANALDLTVSQVQAIILPQAWTNYTPTCSFQTGSGTLSGTGRYQVIGKTVFFQVTVTITSAGTGGSSVVFTLPFTAAATATWWASGRDNNTGFFIGGTIGSGSGSVGYTKYDGSFLATASSPMTLTGFYEIP